MYFWSIDIEKQIGYNIDRNKIEFSPLKIRCFAHERELYGVIRKIFD